MAGRNVVQYEFQGNILPLEKAFSKVRNLFNSYAREAKAAHDGALTPDMAALSKEIKNYQKRLKVLSEKSKAKTITAEEEQEASKIYKKLLTLTAKFKRERDRILAQKSKQQMQEDKKQAEAKDQTEKYSSISSQFRAATQVEQLQNFMTALPNIDPKVVADINAYVEAWRKANEGFKNGSVSAEELAQATKDLDDKTKEYVGSLKIANHEQKVASNAMEQLLSGIISQISSFEFLIRKIKEGITELNDYIESINFLDVALGNVKYTQDNFGKSADKINRKLKTFKDNLDEARWALGLNATKVNTAAATFLSFATAIGITNDEAVDFSQNMTQLSIDMASLYNKDVTEMMTALRSALAGNTRAMMNYGLSVHDATLNEWLLSKGLNKTMNSLSEVDQVLVRYMYILENTAAAQGDLARTLKSPANQLKILQTQVKLLFQNLSSLFNVVIYPAIRILNAILQPLNAFLTALTEMANENYSSSIGSAADATGDWADSLTDVSKASKGLTALDEINMPNGTSNVQLGVSSDISGLLSGFDVYKNFSKETDSLVSLMKALGEAMAPIWSLFSNSVTIDVLTVSLNLLGQALTPITAALEGIRLGFDSIDSWIKTLPGWLQSVIGFVGNLIAGLGSLAGAITVVTIALALFKTLTAAEAFKNFIATIGLMWSSFLKLGTALYAAIAKFIVWIATMIKARIEAFKTTVQQKGLAAALWGVVKATVAAIAKFVVYIARLIVVGAKALFAAIKNLILSKSLWGVALGAIAAAGIAALAVAAVVGTAVAIGAAIQGRNQASEATVGLAKGGVVTGPTFALIGEGQHNEAVVPLGNSPQFKSMKEEIAQNVVAQQNGPAARARSSSTPIILQLNGKELARAILPDLGITRPQTGVKLG